MKPGIRRLMEDLRGARVLVVHPRDAALYVGGLALLGSGEACVSLSRSVGLTFKC